MSTGFQGIRTNSGQAVFGHRFRLEQAPERAPPASPVGSGAPARASEHGNRKEHPADGLRIRLFNVKYSPNLGDGLLSECLEKALITLGASQDTWSIDLAARQAYGDGLAGRRHIMSALDRMPDWLRRQAIRVPLAIHARRNWRPHYARRLEGANAAVIGGGNLISDIDLNFPTKLTLAISEVERLGLPFVVYASGVTDNWTPRGTAMMRKAFSSDLLRGVFVRDRDSKVLWDRQLGDASGFEALVVRDPGLLAAEFIRPSRMYKSAPPVAGVGIMSHIAIRYHSEKAPGPSYLESWYIKLVKGLLSRGFHVAVFTNGSPEDVAYLARLRPRLEAIGGTISFPVQKTPSELCAIISSLNVLIAYRMHAVIASYSYKVPAVGLAWDRKLQSFMTSVGREAYLCDVRNVDPAAAVDLACRAMEEGIPNHEHKQVMGETWQGVSTLLGILEQAS